jgi:hypothetical protein
MVRRFVIAGAAVVAVCGVLAVAPPAALADSAVALDAAPQASVAHPPPLIGASMAYDAATGTVVLFGGQAYGRGYLGDTWTWNGSTWAKQAPASSPPALAAASMAYDAATGTAVLVGGQDWTPGIGLTSLRGTWTWNGTTWTEPVLASGARTVLALPQI